MMIGSTDNLSGNFIQPDWPKKGQQDESGLVSKAVKPESLTQKAVEELTKKLGKEPDKKEENSFAAAYGVEISDEGYTALAQQLNAGQVEESTAQPVIAEQVESAKEEPMVYTKKLEHSRWGVPINCDPAGCLYFVSENIKGILSATSTQDAGIQDMYFDSLADSLNAYLELSGGTDASGALGELREQLEGLKGSGPNPLVDRIISMVDEVRSGHYLDIESDDFHDKNAQAREAFYSLVKSGEIDTADLKQKTEDMFNSRAVEDMIARFETKQDGFLIDALLEADQMPEHLRHPALRDIVSAFHDEKATGHEHIMRNLRELE